ncbi:MAG: hypothetical protein IH932_02870, partial [Thaumarchaeota archaeon]|nr:hypothetical protein [Nitrososphaerota archaeon]
MIQSDSLHRDPEIDALSYRAGQLVVSLDSLLKGYEISIDLPVLKQLRSGPRNDSSVFTATDWKDLLEKLEHQAEPIITLMGSLLEERRALEKSISEKKTTLGSIGILRDLSIGLKELRGFHRTYVIFAVLPMKDVPEVRAALEKSVIVVDSKVPVSVLTSWGSSGPVTITLRWFRASI